MPDSENDDLDQFLRDDKYIPDDSFTQLVMAQLPVARPRARRRRLVLITSFALAGMIFLYQGVTLGIDFTANAARSVSMATNPLFLVEGFTLVAVLGWLSFQLLTCLEEHFG